MANYTKPYRFNVVLNSLQAITPITNLNDVSYEFNWTNIPAGKYDVSFSFLSQNVATYSANDCPAVFLSLGIVPSIYQASGVSGASIISSYFGSLRAQTHAAGQVGFYCNSNDNPEVHINNIPTSEPIRVQIFKNDFVTPFTTATGGNNIADYVLVLSFKKVGDA